MVSGRDQNHFSKFSDARWLAHRSFKSGVLISSGPLRRGRQLVATQHVKTEASPTSTWAQWPFCSRNLFSAGLCHAPRDPSRNKVPGLQRLASQPASGDSSGSGPCAVSCGAFSGPIRSGYEAISKTACIVLISIPHFSAPRFFSSKSIPLKKNLFDKCEKKIVLCESSPANFSTPFFPLLSCSNVF